MQSKHEISCEWLYQHTDQGQCDPTYSAVRISPDHTIGRWKMAIFGVTWGKNSDIIKLFGFLPSNVSSITEKKFGPITFGENVLWHLQNLSFFQYFYLFFACARIRLWEVQKSDVFQTLQCHKFLHILHII